MHNLRLILIAIPVLLLAACVPIPPAAPPAVPQAAATTEVAGAPAPAAVEYNLGETTVTQARFPADSRFRNMPVRLNGVIATPNEGAAPFPVVVILHGTHPGCPVDGGGVDRWPCDPVVEQPNYRGFGYLAERLAANGYVALSININAENTFGFGEPAPGERLEQIVDKHLRALATASAGGENKFGVELEGRADVHRLAFAGHSRGGEMALWLARDREMGRSGADAYGPPAGILMIAPSPGFVDPAAGTPVPLGIILPMCDADVINQEGQHFYEGARLAAGQQAWVTSAFVERANHNYFNSTLGDDPFGRPDRPDCGTRLDAQAQQAFLSDYAQDFFATLFGDPAAAGITKTRLGINPTLPAPAELYGLASRVAVLPAAAERTPIFTPAGAGELSTNRLGGAVLAEAATLLFCEAGYYTPAMRPGTEPCRRASLVIPGDPALAVVSWEQPGAVLRFEIPPGKGDLSMAAAITLRAAVDPLSMLNAEGQGQAFSIQVTDGAGRTASVTIRPDEPALHFPAGKVAADTLFGDLFTGRVPLTTVRIPVSGLEGVDKTDIREIALLFDQTTSGSLFIADLEWVRSGK